MSDYFSLLRPGAPVDEKEVLRLARHGCLDIHRVEWHCCYLSADGMRMLCHYRANDAESVRFVLRQQEFAGSEVYQARSTSRTDTWTGGQDRTIVEIGLSTPNADRLTSVVSTAADSDQLPVLAIVDSVKADSLTLILPAMNPADVHDHLNALSLRADAIWHATEIDPRPSALFEGDSGSNSPVASHRTTAQPSLSPTPDVDAVIIGAGVSGICALQRFNTMGLRARVFDSASDVGGVWYWNRYPGARVDSEIYSYALAFSDDLVMDWDWTELFCAQPEIERYLKHVIDRFDLRRHMTFDTTVISAEYNEAGNCWRVTTDMGETVTARYLILATGTLSAPQLPDYPGMNSFTGQQSHTALWPAEGIPLAGKRVGVVGTGASGVQVIQTIAAEVEQLTVFQRTPTYCLPQRNRRLSDDDRQKIRADWPELLARCRNSYAGFIHDFDPRSGLAVSADTREELFERWWKTPGFAFWIGNFADLMMNTEVNEYACDFLRQKIRQRVNDPQVADTLIPNHPFGSKRAPLENGYYEAFNRSNVELVDIRNTPIEAVSAGGIRTSAGAYPLDVIVYATGFDVGTGALNRMDIRGEGGISIADQWQHGPRTFLGLMVSGFPNLFMVNGPQNPSGLCNAPRCIDQNIDWIAGAIDHLRRKQLTRITPTPDAEQRWIDHVEDAAAGTVLAKNTNSWFYGANTPGRPRRVNIYAPGAQQFRDQAEDIARRGYVGCVLS